jgi:hypothetical protein
MNQGSRSLPGQVSGGGDDRSDKPFGMNSLTERAVGFDATGAVKILADGKETR